MKKKNCITATLYLFTLLGSLLRAEAQLINYPGGFNATSVIKYSGYNVDNPGGFYNVKDFGAKGDGVSDDTQAIQAALDAGRKGINTEGKVDYFFPRPKTVYFPQGTYLLSGSLHWIGQAMMLMGQGRGQTILKLQNHAPGFGNPTVPKTIIQTPSGIHEFHNYIRDLTINTGTGNAGTVAIDFITNNSGGIVNVEITSQDGQGHTAISMTRDYPGPCMFKQVIINGFDRAIKTYNFDYSITFENITLNNQKIVGIENNGNVLIIRKLISNNSVPAIRNIQQYGMVTILDSELKGGSGAYSAIENTEGYLYARNVVTAGYASAIKYKETLVAGSYVPEYVSGMVTNLYSLAASSLNLPIEETPGYHENNPDQWARIHSPNHYGDTGSWQSTISSGKSVMYWETGSYMSYDKTFTVPLSVRKFTGLGSIINNPSGSQHSMTLRITEGDENSPPLFIEHFGYGVVVEHLCKRPVVIKHCKIGNYISSPQSGKIYFEDVELQSFVTFYPQQKVWARQLNTELEDRRIWNKGADLWIMGIKTELKGYVVKTTDCGKTEVLGGLIYPIRTFNSDDLPAFICEEAQQSLHFATSSYIENNMYPVLVRETQNGIVKELKNTSIQGRRFIPLHVGRSPGCTGPVSGSTAGILAGGVYKVIAKSSGKALDVPSGSTSDGTGVVQWTYGGGANQQWKLEPVENGYYKVIAMHSGKVLDVNNVSSSDGATIQQWVWGNADNQKWSVIAVGEGYYKLIAKNSGKALDVPGGSTIDGTKIVQWTYGGGANQQWKLELVGASSGGRLSGEIRDSVRSESASDKLALYPNPASSTVTVSLPQMPEAETTLTVTNAQGQIVHRQQLTKDTHHEFNTFQLANGIYFVTMAFNGVSKTEQLTVIH